MNTENLYAISGSRAAIHHLDGSNTIATHPKPIIYLPTHFPFSELPKGEGALVLPIDETCLNKWSDGYASKAQTYADLFAQPGWQASEFRRALHRKWFAINDWSLKEA